MHAGYSEQNGFDHGRPRVLPDSTHLRLPLARLLQVLMILQSERYPNVRRLAEACGVSRRTIYRDLTILETAGLSIVYQPERQGYELGRDSLLQAPQLDDHEALALFFISRVGSLPEPFASLLPGRQALVKVIHSLPSGLRKKVAECGELLYGAGPAAQIPPERRAIYETILGTLLDRQRLLLRYRMDGGEPTSATLFDLYRLAHIDGQWALVGHAWAEGGIRLYWLPWLEAVQTTGEAYVIPPRFRLEKFLEDLQPKRRGELKEVRLRFSARVAPLVRDMPGKSGQKTMPALDGTVDVSLEVESVDQVLHWALGFGDQVEVLEPQELKDAVCEWANRIIRRYENLRRDGVWVRFKSSPESPAAP